MRVPPGYTEEQVLQIIENLVGVLAPSFVFGYYDCDDIKQEGRIYALELLATGKYDPARRPLENFLYTHIYNRLDNLRRNKFRRRDAPCKSCHQGEPCEVAIATGRQSCKKYARWLKKNNDKAQLARPLSLNPSYEGASVPPEDSLETQELLDKIRAKLPLELQATFLQIKDGVSVPKSKRDEVERYVREILKEDAPCPNEDD